MPQGGRSSRALTLHWEPEPGTLGLKTYQLVYLYQYMDIKWNGYKMDIININIISQINITNRTPEDTDIFIPCGCGCVASDT